MTMSLFFTLHFIVPFLVLVIVLLHILLLHESGSSRKIFLRSKKIKFGVKFLEKDSINLLIIVIYLSILTYSPYELGDPENFIHSNLLLSPVHIKPEWYFLWAYAILRAIPSKLGGVISLILAVVVLFFLPFLNKKINYISTINKFLFLIVLINLT